MMFKNYYKILILFGIFFTAISCSLKYDEAVNAEDDNPEFVFYNTKVSRYESNKKTAEIDAEYIEQYKSSDATYAKKVAFKTVDNKGNVETEGTCGMLYSDTEKEMYELYDEIKLFSKKHETNFYADILRWNGKSEQLTSGRTDTVRLEKEGTVIVGSGFSASGVSGRYNFTGSVSGDIEAKDAGSSGENTSESTAENNDGKNVSKGTDTEGKSK